MGRESTLGKPTTRRYSPEEKAQAVRLVRQLRKELGTSQGTVVRVAEQLVCEPAERCGSPDHAPGGGARSSSLPRS